MNRPMMTLVLLAASAVYAPNAVADINEYFKAVNNAVGYCGGKASTVSPPIAGDKKQAWVMQCVRIVNEEDAKCEKGVFAATPCANRMVQRIRDLKV